MGHVTNALLTFWRTSRSPLLVFAIGVAALIFIANDARNQRLRAGIDDDCAQAQFMMRMFPMTRCFSIEQFVNMHRGDGGDTPAPMGAPRHARSEEKSSGDAASSTNACATSAESANPSPNPERPRMSDYVAALLQGYECGPEH